jgi:heme exporter protein D
MATIRSYRLLSLALLIAAVLAIFLGAFFVWVLAPIALLCVFYLVFVWIEERRALKNGKQTSRSRRRAQLAHEADLRRTELDRPSSTP